MITVINGIANTFGRGRLSFKADRAYDVYALEGHSEDGDAKITLGITNISDTLVSLAHGITGGGYDWIKWSGHLILLDGDMLGMEVHEGVDSGRFQFKIVLIPIAIVKKVEKEVEKEWLP
ncbi:unnamed protein product [marine sediment metagenome]|uniref:Uncharacterized protein n=1 Tax=marine sediment metagenome TaxID=412755 RepID=X1KFZ1_9ZZZZ